jgi:iron(III) transport system substrate-binding protein
MKIKIIAGFIILIYSVFFLCGSELSAASVEQLVSTAKQEGVLEFYAPGTLGAEGTKQLEQAFNKRFGTSIKVNYTQSGSMTADVSKYIGEAAAGTPPQWDLMVLIDALHGSLWKRKLHIPFDYRSLGVDGKAIHYNNGTVSFANQVVLPAYNSKTMDPKDVPKRWEDLLDPKWKGKLGIVTGVGHIDYLAIRWGEKKFLDFGRALAKQSPIPGKLGELYTRLQIGEISLTTTLTNSFIIRAQKEGAPLEHAQVQPIVAPAYHIGVLKGARHANAAHLFASFLVSPEAQTIWERYNGQTSAFVPGTKMYNYVQGKDVIYLGQNDVDLVNKAVVDLNKILGFNP